MSGFSQEVKDLVYKMASVNLCSNVDGACFVFLARYEKMSYPLTRKAGQITVGLMCAPPGKGEESHRLFERERTEILSSLKKRAQAVGKKLNDERIGISCVTPEGALYAFPKGVLLRFSRFVHRLTRILLLDFLYKLAPILN